MENLILFTILACTAILSLEIALIREYIKGLKVNMDYEKRHKEAVSDTFPELKESEDERIRKALIKYFNAYTSYSELRDDVTAGDAIAWLKKYSDKDSQVAFPTFTFDDVLALQCCMETVKKVQEDKDLYEQLQSLHDRLHDAYWLKKQGKPKFHEGDKLISTRNPNLTYEVLEVGHINELGNLEYKVKIFTNDKVGINYLECKKVDEWAKLLEPNQVDKVEQNTVSNLVETWKDMRLEVYQQASGNRHEPNYSDDTTKMFSLNDIDEIIEKLSEQKPIDKVESNEHAWLHLVSDVLTWKDGIGQYLDDPRVQELTKQLCSEYRQKLYKHNIKMERTEEIVANKQLRKDLDEKIQEVKNLPVSRERSICITKLQEAVMWLGMDLKRLNAENPYPSSKDPSTGDKIEPTADGLKF